MIQAKKEDVKNIPEVKATINQISSNLEEKKAPAAVKVIVKPAEIEQIIKTKQVAVIDVAESLEEIKLDHSDTFGPVKSA